MIDLTSRYPAILEVLFLIISSAVSFYFYKNVSLDRLKKYFLAVLKTAGIFLILVLLIEPSLITFIKSGNESLNLVIIDNTRSNELLTRSGEPKSRVIDKLLDKGLFNGKDYKLFTISDSDKRPAEIINKDSIKYSIAETNLSGALNSLVSYIPDENFGSVTVISDGIFNSGGNPLYPARLFRVPFVTIGIGDTIQKKDAVLDKVYFENKAFTETDNLIRAYINLFELQNENIEISLLREGSVIQTKNVVVTNSPQSDEIDFVVRESQPGKVKYSIRISEIPGEVTYKNNKTEFLIDYVENKTNLLVISAGPGYDNSAVSEILKRVNNYSVTFKTVKNSDEFYEGPIDYKIFGELSAVMLFGFPVPQFSSEITSDIVSKIMEFNIPVIFFAQKSTDYKKLEMFDQLIPFTVTKQSSGESEFNPQVVSVSDNSFFRIENEINSAPQIFKNISGIIQKPGSITLMTDKTSGEPVFITRTTGKSKSTAFLGYGLWRWNLNPRAKHEKTLENFIVESVNLTLLHEKKTRFKIYPAKDVFDYTEKVPFIAEVFDDEFKPTRNANVTAKVLSGNTIAANNIEFKVSENKYTAIIPPLPYGDYNIEAEADLNNNFYARDKSRFLVDSVNAEFLVTKSNFESMRELAQNTGGEFFTASSNETDISDKLNSIFNSKVENAELQKKARFNLWENKYILLVIILIFTTEWIIRKRNNIP